jgi:hypothetical protein
MKNPEGELRCSYTLSLTSAPDGDAWSKPRPGRFTPRGRDLVPIAQETGWGPEQLWTGDENIATTGIRCETNLAFNNTG